MNAIRMSSRRWNGLMLGLLVVAAMQLSATTNASRNVEPWPALLSDTTVNADPEWNALHERAQSSLARITQAAAEMERPL